MGFPTKVWMTRPYLWNPKPMNNEGLQAAKIGLINPWKWKKCGFLWIPMIRSWWTLPKISQVPPERPLVFSQRGPPRWSWIPQKWQYQLYPPVNRRERHIENPHISLQMPSKIVDFPVYTFYMGHEGIHFTWGAPGCPWKLVTIVSKLVYFSCLRIIFGTYKLYFPKNPDPSLGMLVPIPSEKNRNVGVIPDS